MPHLTDEEIRAFFWDTCGFTHEVEAANRLRRLDRSYRTDVRLSFNDFIDGLLRAETITEDTAYNITLT